MNHDSELTYDCDPTLDDQGVIDFCKSGILKLEGVVSEDINLRTIEYVEEHDGPEPREILSEDWFVDAVIKNPQATGIIRSLLGKNFGLPINMANHRIITPSPSQEWHTDAGTTYAREINYLQVFYLPQECTKEMGPTELLPGSHFLSSHRDAMKQMGRVRGSYYASAPAGSIFITYYGLWHRRSESSVSSLRNNLKYNYWRRTEPTRDWIANPDFDVSTASFESPKPTYRPMWRDMYDTAELYFWLRGEIDKFGIIGGLGWPGNARSYGVPKDIQS